MESKLINYEGYVCIYYSYMGKTTRHSTGIKWADKNSKENIKVILSLKQRFDDIIKPYVQEHGEKPEVDWLKEQLDRPGQIKTKEILVLLDQLIEEKRLKIKPQSIKDWTNLRTALKRYQEETKTLLYLGDINKKWYDKFQYFLSQPYEVTTSRGKIIKRDGLNSNTIRKRVVIFNVLLKENGILVPKGIDLVKSYDADFEVLTPIEIREVYDLPLTGMKEKIRDIFIVLCLSGMRFSDYETLTPQNIKGDTIDKRAKKTNERFIVPIHPVVKEIFKKYSVGNSVLILPTYKIQVFDREIKEILKVIPAFQRIFSKNSQTFNNAMTINVLRYEMIASHTGRHSFITMHVNKGTPIDKLAEMTGHKTLSILHKYYKKFTESNRKYMDNIII